MDGIQLRVGDLIYGVKKRLSLIIIMTVVGLVFGVVLSGVYYLQGTMTRDYEITATVIYMTRAKNGTYLTKDKLPGKDDITLAPELIDYAKFILKSRPLIDQVIEDVGLIGVSYNQINSNLRISQEKATAIMNLTLTWRNADEGTEIMKALLKAATPSAQEAFGRGAFDTIIEPSAKYIVGGSMNVPIWGIMAVMGMFLGVGVAMLEILLKPTLINLKDVGTEFNLEILGTISDNPSLANAHMMLFQDSLKLSSLSQEFSATSYILRNRLGTKEGCHRFYVTSAVRGEGRTTVAAHLAYNLAEMEHKVLLIDLDIRNPGIGAAFLENVDFSRSLNALYRGEIDVQEAVVTINGYLDILPTLLEHNSMPLDGSMLQLVNNLSEGYEYVVIDAPPIGTTAETLAITKVAETAIMVIGFDIAPKAAIKEAINTMDKSGVRIIGCIVNRESEVEAGNIFSATPRSEHNRKKKQRKRKKKAAAKRISAAQARETTAARKEERRKQKKEKRLRKGLFGRRKDKDPQEELKDKEALQEEKVTHEKDEILEAEKLLEEKKEPIFKKKNPKKKPEDKEKDNDQNGEEEEKKEETGEEMEEGKEETPEPAFELVPEDAPILEAPETAKERNFKARNQDAEDDPSLEDFDQDIEYEDEEPVKKEEEEEEDDDDDDTEEAEAEAKPKKKRGLRRLAANVRERAKAAEVEEDTPFRPRTSRNILAEVTAELPSKGRMSDEELMDALFRIGQGNDEDK